jgi:endonuclease YncB( thermonuclease family)
MRSMISIYKRVQSPIAGLVAGTLFAFGAVADAAAEPAVKRSRAGICHEQGTQGYGQTIHFKSFPTIDACLKSGGRLPKNSSTKKSHFDPTKPAHPGDDGVLFGPLVRVVDGDTIDVRIQGAVLRVRLIGIDAPELEHAPMPEQPFANEARGELATLIGERECVLGYVEGDGYGRLVAHLWIGDTYVNGEMIKRGMAMFYSVNAPDDLLDLYQEEARGAQRGIWALPPADRIPPWEWRKEER